MKKILHQFFDASCFPIIPISDLEEVIKHNKNFVITPVVNEIRKGMQLNPNKKEFSVILDSNGKLKNEFNEISLADCNKDEKYNFDVSQLMFLKKNPLLCSAYFTWIISAINPATVHDFHRHAFNEIMFQVLINKGNISELNSLESWLRVNETQLIEKYDLETGRNLLVKRPWLLKARRKRFDEAKAGRIVLTDYQTILTALLYGCKHGVNVLIWTVDRDLIDIKDNLYKSLIERYAVNELLTEKVNSFNEKENETYINYGIDVELKIDVIMEKVKEVLNNIDNSKKSFTVTLWLYRSDYNKVFSYNMKIPIWLRNFVLVYKKHLDCISLSDEYEKLFTFKYSMHPDFMKRTVNYKLKLRRLSDIKVCIHDCHSLCRYVKTERESPLSLGEFAE